jgi:hypothetical protein
MMSLNYNTADGEIMDAFINCEAKINATNNRYGVSSRERTQPRRERILKKQDLIFTIKRSKARCASSTVCTQFMILKTQMHQKGLNWCF